VVAEINQGGAMVEQVLREVDENISFRAVHASRGKKARAEPVAALYEQGRVAHVGTFAELEDEMCNVISEGGKSPDRLDALVWAVTDLMLTRRTEPRVRMV
jgi:phage terminase large subunit-like protein